MAKKEFRTAKLQLEFILSRIFADGYFSIVPRQNGDLDYEIEDRAKESMLDRKANSMRRLSDVFSDDVDENGNIPLAKNESVVVSDLIAVAKETLTADHDPNFNTDKWADNRRAFEIANAEEQKKLPRLTEEQEEELRGAHLERKASKKKAEN